MYLSGVVPWKSSQWVAPSPEEIARIRKEAGTHDAALAEEGDIQAQTNGEVDTGNKEERESDETNEERE